MGELPPDAFHMLTTLSGHPQVDRVLTRGGSGAWPARCATLTRYARMAGPRVTVLPGGGLDREGLRALTACGSIVEAHVGRAARIGGAVGGRVSAEAVRDLRRAAGWA